MRLAGGRCPLHGVSVGEAAAPLLRRSGGRMRRGKTPPLIRRRKDQAGSFGAEEKAV